jgi:hypothetical protein
MTTKISKKLGRRDMLKVMTAGMGGLVVSAFLPNKWVKPVVNVGVSPVHAQASITTGTITGVVYQGNPAPFDKSNTGKNLSGSWNPLFGAEVTVDGMPLLTSTTGQDGVYTIANVPVGSRTITCVPPQNYYIPYNPVSADAVPVSVNGIANTVQDFYFENQG